MSESDAIRNVEEAAAWLEGLINVERLPLGAPARLGLEPIHALLERLGNPERALSVVHVAGSKGKGSTCLLAESILRAAGERVGTFTSPHLERWTERFRVDGEEVHDDVLAAAVEHVRPHVEALRALGGARTPSFFDATTAAALLVFRDAGLDRTVLEVGLGGRLDSTNAVAPAVTCITSIELEHTDKLGDTLEAIAGEKAGIIKSGVPCVMGRLPAPAAAVVRGRACELGAPLAALGDDFFVQEFVQESTQESVQEDVQQGSLCFKETDGFEVEAVLSALGHHQRDNAAVAIAAVRRLRAHDDAALAEAVCRGLASVVLPGRVELLGTRPWIIVDSAHTVASAAVLRAALAELPASRMHLVLSVSGDKRIDDLLPLLLPDAATGRVTVTRAEQYRSLPPEELAAHVRRAAPGLALDIAHDARSAIARAREALRPDELLVVTGSIYLAGVARSVLRAPRTGRR